MENVNNEKLDAIQKKLRKLQKMYEGAKAINSEGEAQAAAAAIQRILLEYNITMEEVGVEKDKDVMTELYRVTKKGGRVAINVANTGRKPYVPLSSYINIIAIESGFLCRGEIIWDKGASVGTSCAWGSWRSPSNPSLRDIHEYIMIYSKGDYKHDGKKDDATLEAEEFTKNTKSIWQMQTASAKALGHPAPYPLILPQRIIRLYSFKGDIVFDPFLGSGTTVVACIKEKRHFIGFELSKEYFDKAIKRIKKEQSQL